MKDAILRKARESAEVKLRFIEENAEALERCVRALVERFQSGGRLLVLGNGGSACDAQHIAVEFLHPVIEKRKPLPAVALVTDIATLTAIGNDTDFSRVFVDQLELLARPRDALLGISTSGASANVNRALKRAREMGLLTLGGAGLAFTADCYVVTPICCPGGDIGELAVNGTVIDLAMGGATPLYLSRAFILEEGRPIGDHERVIQSVRRAAVRAGVDVVTGDTKVVGRGSGDKVFINTSGIGLVPPGVDLSSARVQPGDAILVSGP